jgi:hypothetical protein
LSTRLKRGGVATVFDRAASSPLELVEKFIIEKFEERESLLMKINSRK